MENNEGCCLFSRSARAIKSSEHELLVGHERILPTTNGIAMEYTFQDSRAYVFSMEINKPFLEVQANDKCFALMSDTFRPFVTISCIGTLDQNKNIISPAKLSYQKITDRKYTITITPCSPLGKGLLIEANLYEPKLLQDTTVESKNPYSNNAFGSVGFLGTSQEFGEQWLYTRPDFSVLSDLNDKKIIRAQLHLPKLNYAEVNLVASEVASRFCSFGSTWNNKIAATPLKIQSQHTPHYVNLDITPIISNNFHRLLRGEGFILKPQNKNSGFSVIATGDSYLFPQILEIHYR